MAAGARPRLSGIVLAAGAGERMGGPKAVLLVGGEPLARVHARRLREAGCGVVVIVTRAELVQKLVEDGVVVVASGAPDPAGSLAVGLGALAPEGEDVVVVTPVDAWPARVETIGALVAAVEGGAKAATPRYAGRGGHPVVVRARVILEGKGRPLREVLEAVGEGRVRVDVEDEGVRVDLDTPEDVEKWTGRGPRFG